MASIMMQLGDFRFSTHTAAYQTLQQRNHYHWATHRRIKGNDHHQFMGRSISCSLKGEIYPHYRGGLAQIERLNHYAAKGEPQIWVDGLGHVNGLWIVKSIDEIHTLFMNAGQPKKQTFTLELKKHAELPHS